MSAVVATPMTDALRAVLRLARQEAERRHNIYVDVEHLLLGLLRQTDGTAWQLLQQAGADSDALYAQVAEAVGMERPEPNPVRGYSSAAQRALFRAQQEAHALEHAALDTGHVLLALLAEEDGAVHEALGALPLSAEDVRAFLRAHPPAAPAVTPARTEFVLVPERRKRAPQGGKSGVERLLGRRWLWILGGFALLRYLLWTTSGTQLLAFALVMGGWVVSVVLHEFSHAIVAYWGGDHTVKDKGYLSLNPLRYTHPMLSIALPLLFLAMGGIGLPGGAVYIETHRLRSKWWRAAVSAAGPAANALLALVLALPFLLGQIDPYAILLHYRLDTLTTADIFWASMAFLAMLQVTAVFFNLLPVPPLDGYGIIEPFLDEGTRLQFARVGMMGIWIVFMAFWFIDPIANAFWERVFAVTGHLDIPAWLVVLGRDLFMFWRLPQ